MKAIVSSPCRALGPALAAYLDGELDPSHVVDVEAHLAECGTCRERIALDRAIRVSLRRQATLTAPASLRERMKVAMAAERAKEQAAPAPESRASVTPLAHAAPAARRGRPISEARSVRPLRARYVVPFAAAASVAFAISMRQAPSTVHPQATQTASATSEAQPSLYNNASMTGLDGVLDDLVSFHAQPVPPEVTHPDDVRKFDPFVGVPVEPPKFQPFGAKWVGGRMMPMRDYRAAMLQYTIAGGHRVSVYVYDPRHVRQESHLLHERVVRDEPVFVGNVRGYNVAATERKGVGYAVATDLGEPESVELVAAGVP